MTNTEFHPGIYVDEPNRDRAIEHLGKYMLSFTGRCFEHFADTDPYRITANDLLAVTMLGVDIPATASIEFLGPRSDEIEQLLRAMPAPEIDIWNDDADLGPNCAARTLWTQTLDVWGMGRTKKSKLLAAKRPRLIPIADSVVLDALGVKGNQDDWVLWQDLMRSIEGERIRRDVDAIKTALPEVRHLSVLRILDIAIWMQETQ